MNYYMWWGGYNRHRSAAAGIMNMYASDAPLCSSGQPNQPKFDHFTELANVLADVAPVLLDDSSAMGRGNSLLIQNSTGIWVKGEYQTAFTYQSEKCSNCQVSREVVFVENASNEAYLVMVPILHDTTEIASSLTIQMQPYSGLIIVDGKLVFDSASISPNSQSYERKIIADPVPLQNWVYGAEPIQTSALDNGVIIATQPIEQSELTVEAMMSTDYAWFETSFSFTHDTKNVSICVDTQSSDAISVYIDQRLVGEADTHEHTEGNVTLRITLGDITMGTHNLSILSESLGYSNLICRWSTSCKQKRKGITGDVSLLSLDGEGMLLTDGRLWKSSLSHYDVQEGGLTRQQITALNSTWGTESFPSNLPTWIGATFESPDYNPSKQELYLSTVVGRGHLWLNGNDLGRYWNITRGDTEQYSQQFYFLPYDYLFQNGSMNELLFFDVFGSITIKDNAKLIISMIEPSSTNVFEDDVGFTDACL
jgi:hypothetical protein